MGAGVGRGAPEPLGLLVTDAGHGLRGRDQDPDAGPEGDVDGDMTGKGWLPGEKGQRILEPLDRPVCQTGITLRGNDVGVSSGRRCRPRC